MIEHYPDNTVALRPLVATDLEAALAEARAIEDAGIGMRGELDRASRGEPVIVTGTPEQLRAMEREMNLGRAELAKRRARAKRQRQARKVQRRRR